MMPAMIKTEHKSRQGMRQNLRRMSHNHLVSSRPWHGMAFIIEAVVLLAFIALAISVFFRLFAYSEGASAQSQQLSAAVAYASNTAEQFAASPTSMSDYSKTEDGLHVTCQVEPNKTSAGTLYKATITISDPTSGDELYTLHTASYVSGVK